MFLTGKKRIEGRREEKRGRRLGIGDGEKEQRGEEEEVEREER
jgi:hypothetical protein